MVDHLPSMQEAPESITSTSKPRGIVIIPRKAAPSWDHGRLKKEHFDLDVPEEGAGGGRTLWGAVRPL